MELPKELRENDRLTHTLLAVGLSLFALMSFRKGKRLRGALAGLGAVALVYDTSSESVEVVEHVSEKLETESTTEDKGRRCAACGEPIVPGQPRRPNENDQTVHEACLETPA